MPRSKAEIAEAIAKLAATVKRCSLPAVLGLTLMACSTNGDTTSGEAPSATPQESAPEQPSPTPTRATVGVGVPFKLAEGSEQVPIEVNVTKFQCGIKRYPFKASSVSGSIPNDAPAVPSPGQQFCQADFSIRNAGKQPLKDGAQPGGRASLFAGDTEYASTDLSDAITYTFLSNANNSGKNVGWFLGDVINPGQSVSQIQVWEVPAAARVKEIAFTQDESAGDSVRVSVE